MSSPHDPLEAFGNLLSGGRHVYPPAPKGFHYEIQPGGRPAPPGYKYAKMSDIVKATGTQLPGQKYHYKFGAHTPEGIRERADESMRISGTRKGYNDTGTMPGLTQTPHALNPPPPIAPAVPPVPGTLPWPPNTKIVTPFAPPPAPMPSPATAAPMSDEAFAKEMEKLLAPKPGSPNAAPSHIPLPQPRPQSSLADDIQKMLLPGQKALPASPPQHVPLPQPRPQPKSMQDMNIQELNDLGNRIYRGEKPDVRGLTDTTQSRMDAKTEGHRMIPSVLSEMWKNMTSPPGPAFDPHNANLDELKYQPLPNEEEQ